MTAAYEDDGILVNSGDFSGLTSAQAKEAIADYLEEKGQGKPAVNFRLRDWGISRQRYWGAPIPIIYCEQCGMVPVPETDLPVVLPLDVQITGEGGSPLAQLPSFYRGRLPHLRRPGPPGNRHHGHLRGVLLVFPALRLPRLPRGRPGPGPGGLLGPGGPVHRRHRTRRAPPALRPLLHQGPAGPGAGQDRRALSAPPHPGHGHQRRRQDDQVQGQRGGPGVPDPGIRHRYRPALHALCRPAGKGPGVERPGGGRLQPLPAPPLEPGALAVAGFARGFRLRRQPAQASPRTCRNSAARST